MKTRLERQAERLRWALLLVWGLLVLLYLAGRLGLSLGLVEVKSHGSGGGGETPVLIADVSMVLLTIALSQLGRMLRAVAEGELFSIRVVASFRAFAGWLLLVAAFWIVAPAVATLIAGPGDDHSLEFRLQMGNLLTLGMTLVLFLVARLLEQARIIEAENREIV